MNRRSLVRLTGLSIAFLAPAAPLLAQTANVVPAYADETTRYTANQLDNLVGPIALYPDALLAQVLVAATFPDQVEDAAKYVRANGTNGIDDQSWDVSVKAVAHYASALNMMDDKADWTTTLGRAYANQSSDVMAAVQRMRAMAASQGNLVSTPQQQVVNEGSSYVIVPAQPRVIYVPVYDPVVIYTRPVFNVGFSTRYWSFGIGFPIGGWLSYDLDWNRRTVYYNGWNDAYYEYGGGWRARSRPYIVINNIYVNPRYRNVYVNRDVYRRPVNYYNVDRYVGVHRDTYFDARNRDRGRGYGDRGNDRGPDRGYDRGNSNGGRSNDGYTGRTAKPRDAQPTATPEGYRNGGGERRAESPQPSGRDNSGRDNSGRDNSSRGQMPQRDARPQVQAPDVRRSEPRQSRGEARIEARVEPRNESRGEPRGESRRAEVRQAPRQEQPRQQEARSSQPRDGGGRSAVARGERGRGNRDK